MIFPLSILSACLLSGPPVSPNINPAPCKEGGSELVQVKTVKASTGKLSIDIIMKLPCSEDKIDSTQKLYSMAFYDANELVIPSDLMNIKVKSVTANCGSAASREAEVKADSGTYTMDQGAGVTFSVGTKHLNSLQPVYLKYSVDNGVGTGNDCALSGSETSPFVIDKATYSPVYYNGTPVAGNAAEMDGLLTIYSRKLASFGGAPIYSYGILLDSSSQGIPGTSVTGGTEFKFDIHLKAGAYYIVLSQIKNYLLALNGDYSLQNARVFTADDKFDSSTLGFMDYQKDCNKNIQTCAKRYTVV